MMRQIHVLVTMMASCLPLQAAFASEVQLGVGNLSIQGGILGLQTEVNTSVSLFTVKEQHVNLFKTDWFYNYKLSTYQGGKVFNETDQVSGLSGGRLKLPSTQYEWQGTDAEVTLGYDLFKKGEFDYIGVGVTLGIAAPYINNTGSQSAGTFVPGSTNPVPAGETQVDLIRSKTKLSGFKLGPKLMFSKSLNRMASVYGELGYANQNVDIENQSLNVSTNIGGDYFNYALGMRYQPLKTKKDLGFVTIEPSLYFTLGLNYSELNLDKFQVDLSGNQYELPVSDFNASSTSLNFGLGYRF